MLIRPKYHWISLALSIFWLLMAGILFSTKSDNVIVIAYLHVFFAGLILALWSSVYTTVSDRVLTKHVLFLTFRSFPLDEITVIAPHHKNGKWGYGTVVNIFDGSGKKLTLQPNHPEKFLTELRLQTPKAAWQL